MSDRHRKFVLLKIIYSNNKAKIEDKNNNILIMDNFKINQLTNTISASKVVLKDQDQNNYFMDSFKYKLDNKDFAGKDIYIKLGSQESNDDNYRFKGRTIIQDSKQTIVTKGVFTTCKESDTWLHNTRNDSCVRSICYCFQVTCNQTGSVSK